MTGNVRRRDVIQRAVAAQHSRTPPAMLLSPAAIGHMVLTMG
jgi:hypothetical protein